MKRLVKSALILFMWYPFRMVIAFLPLSWTASIGALGGKLLRAISRDKQRIIAGEFRNAFPSSAPAERDRWVGGSFANYCQSEIEVLLYPSLNRAYIERYFTVEGREHLDAALKQGRGVLLFQAHFGAFQMTMPAIGYLGYTMNQISASAAVWKENADSQAHKKMFDIKARCEYALPVKHISVTESLRPVFRALEKNEIVGITVDGGGGKKVVPLRFLGRDANFQTGAPDLAISTGAAIIPAFILTEAGLRHRLVLHPPILPDPAAGKEENRIAILRAFAAILEGYVQKRPDHYGYTLGLRRLRAAFDAHPFFNDYRSPGDLQTATLQGKVADHAETK